MGRKKKNVKPSESKEDKEIRVNAELSDYSISFGDQVRFLDFDDCYTFGKVMGTNKDGSITLFSDFGSTRCIMPERLQIEQVTVGPRGGKKRKWIGIS